MRFAPSRHSYGADIVSPTQIVDGRTSETVSEYGGFPWLLIPAIPVVLGVVLLPTFVVGPFVVKAIKPEWSYGRRLGASLAFSMAVGALTRVVSAARASKEPK